MTPFPLILALILGHTCQWWWPEDPTAEALREKLMCGFQTCMTGPGVLPPSGCCLDVYDVDGDGDVDLKDLAKFHNCMTEIDG